MLLSFLQAKMPSVRHGRGVHAEGHAFQAIDLKVDFCGVIFALIFLISCLLRKLFLTD